MLLRTYRADTLNEALSLVRADLGQDATIVASRRVHRGFLSGSKLEVTATLSGESRLSDHLREARRVSEEARADPVKRTAVGRGVSTVDASYVGRAMLPLRKDMLRLREELSHLVEAIGRRVQEPRVDVARLEGVLREILQVAEGEGPRTPLLDRLVGAGMSSRGAEEIARAVASEMGPEGAATAPLEHLAAAVVQRKLRYTNPVEVDTGAPRRVAIVGPSGVGKTTTLAKIAARASLVHHQGVALVGFDNEGIGAAESVKALAQTIGLPYEVARDGAQLQRAVASFSVKNLVLIDTTGYSPRRHREISALGEILAKTGSEAHLVLSTELREMELDSALAAFSLLRPRSLSISKVDQTLGLGGIYDAATRSQLPLMYLCNGRRVPEDIEEATASKVAALILGLQYN